MCTCTSGNCVVNYNVYVKDNPGPGAAWLRFMFLCAYSINIVYTCLFVL